MDIIKCDVYSGPNIGIYTKTNDEIVFVPNGYAKTKAEKLSNFLKNEFLPTSVANTRLLGILMVVNNNGILLPGTCYKHEIEHLKKSTDLNVGVLDSKHNALGNLICTNDNGCIMSPLIPKSYVKVVKDVLGTEVIQKRVAGYNQVGAMIVANSIGGIIHPETDEDDIKIISSVLGVKIEPATINGGVPVVASGVLANNKSIVVGPMTNGPEIMMLTRAFIN